jgi:hypothetical protein
MIMPAVGRRPACSSIATANRGAATCSPVGYRRAIANASYLLHHSMDIRKVVLRAVNRTACAGEGEALRRSERLTGDCGVGRRSSSSGRRPRREFFTQASRSSHQINAKIRNIIVRCTLLKIVGAWRVRVNAEVAPGAGAVLRDTENIPRDLRCRRPRRYR